MPCTVYEILFYHMPFGKKRAYAEEVFKVSLERLAHLIRVCGFLLQTRATPDAHLTLLNASAHFASEGMKQSIVETIKT